MTEPASHAAAAIMRLINERPGSPSAAEIEAVLAKALPAPDDLLTTKGATQALAQAWDLITVLGETDSNQRAQMDKLAPEDRVRFDHYQRAAYHRHGILEQTILGLEPQSIDDVLSLLLITDTEFDSFASNHSDHQSNPGTEREAEVIERAMHAMIRWLVHKGGASSPLLERYSVPARLVPLAEQMAIVLERAQELAKQDEDTSEVGG